MFLHSPESCDLSNEKGLTDEKHLAPSSLRSKTFGERKMKQAVVALEKCQCNMRLQF